MRTHAYSLLSKELTRIDRQVIPDRIERKGKLCFFWNRASQIWQTSWKVLFRIVSRTNPETYTLLRNLQTPKSFQHSPPSIFLQLVTSKRLGFLIEALLLLHHRARTSSSTLRLLRSLLRSFFPPVQSTLLSLSLSLFLSLSVSPFRLSFLQCSLEHDSGRWLDLTSSSSSAKPLSLPTYRLPFFFSFILARWPCEGRVNEQHYERERESERGGTWRAIRERLLLRLLFLLPLLLLLLLLWRRVWTP